MRDFDDFLNRRDTEMFNREELLRAKRALMEDDTVDLWMDTSMLFVRKVHETAMYNGFTDEQAFEFAKLFYVTYLLGGAVE